MKAILMAFALMLGFVGPGQQTRPAMKMTIYDDGLSCPGNCDAHVVMSSKDNGTASASDPLRPREEHVACTVGKSCRICFDANDASCMVATYRGNGPPAGTFDFTPAFYRENCGKAGIPAALAVKCASLDAIAKTKGYLGATNCIATPGEPICAAIIAAANAKRIADEPVFQACLADGQSAFNKKRADRSTRRANDCSYSEASTGGPNSKGVRWQVLMPAACRPGTYVGKDGTDCCTSDARYDAQVDPECSGFFVGRRVKHLRRVKH